MKLIICLDDRNGMLFNHRRQSQDTELRKQIFKICNGRPLWMNSYSAEQFSEKDEINISEECLSEAAKGEYCFIENQALLPYEKWIEQIIIFRWNRLYPSDFKFDIPLACHNWKCVETYDFKGSSHEKITVEVFEK